MPLSSVHSEINKFVKSTGFREWSLFIIYGVVGGG